MAQFSWISLVSLNHEFTSSMNYNFFFSIYYLLEWIKEICPLKHLKKNTGNPLKLTPTNLYDSTEFIIHQYFIKLIEFVLGLLFQLALYVLSFLEPKALLKAAQTCRYWRVLAEDNLLWREKCKEEGITETLVYGSNRLRRRTGCRSPWKALYMRQHQIEQNWRAAELRSPKVQLGLLSALCMADWDMYGDLSKGYVVLILIKMLELLNFSLFVIFEF